MRKLYILRGVPGSGKSTFIKNNKLEPFTISSDSIRLHIESLAYDLEGNPMITQRNNQEAWQELMKRVQSRMNKGCLTIVDATHCTFKDIKSYYPLVKKYKYELIVVDFECSLEELKRNNLKRDTYKVVSEKVINKFYEKKKTPLPEEVQVIQPEEFQDSLQIPIVDLNSYKHIYAIGDLQGCFESLNNFFKENTFSDDNYYIFVGDFIDRGIENKEALEFILSIANKDNVCLIEGNHERHLFSYVYEEGKPTKTFLNKTLPQIQDINKYEIKNMLLKLKDLFLFTYNNKNYIVTHTGLPFMPKELALIPSRQFIRGIGTHGDDVDTLFSEKEHEWIQIHGHRNNFNHPILYKNNINLEGKVEFGGSLRVVSINKKETKGLEYKQTVIDKNLKEKQMQDNRSFIERLRDNEYIKEKDLGDNVSSFNFTKKVFYKKIWNNQTIKARGLFLNNQTGKVVARSYEKFFNMNEREETNAEAIKNLKYPLTGYLKENGFLGICSVHNGEIFWASKSTNKSDFAGYFKDIAEKQLDLEFLKEFCSRGFSLTFEVIDIENDPHIIEYNESKVVLLDVIYNKEDFKKMPYEQVIGIAKKLKAPLKEKVCVLNNYEAFEEWLATVQDIKEEGYVIEDSSGFMFKIKLPFYNYWKTMRTVKERILNDRELREGSVDSTVEKMLKMDKETLKKDIISIRNILEKDDEND